MRQPDCYVIINTLGGGSAVVIEPARFERLVRGPIVFGFWRVWVKR